jgi:predicted Fe-Mo cluster-binding NifX family protein
VQLGVNILIGSSDGRRVARKLGLPLIRCAFPIHDFVGGQRARTLGFDGSLSLLDQVANAMITHTETTYRTELFDKHFRESDITAAVSVAAPARREATPVSGLRRFAVATRSGVLVDLHFGRADEFYIFDSDGEDVRFIEKRRVDRYCIGPGTGENKDDKWDTVLRAIADCAGVLTTQVGEVPSSRLTDAGIVIITTYDQVETAVKSAANLIMEDEQYGTTKKPRIHLHKQPN